MSWKSLSLCSRLWSQKVILPRGLRCTSTWTRSVTFPTHLLLSHSAHNKIFPEFLYFPFLLFCQGEEKQLSEKSLHPPASPAMLPDHLKCNILKAQMEAAFRVSTKPPPNHLSLVYSVTNISICFSSTMKKEAPTTPRVKNSNEILKDRPVPTSRLHVLTRFCTCI